MGMMEAIWRCPRFEQIVHLWNTCPECGARPSIKEELRVMIRRQRLVSVSPAVMVYQRWEGWRSGGDIEFTGYGRAAGCWWCWISEWTVG